MMVRDRIYGTEEIHEPVLLALLRCPSMDRLRRIEQLGLPREMYLPGFSRHEHSVGVMLLLRRLGASVEEQVAGLLHDVSHTAFSHVADWFYKIGRADSYQDSRHEAFLMASEIPTLLKGFDLAVERIADHHLFSLLEADIPALCADRVDYTLRQVPEQDALAYLPHFVVHNGQIAFDDARVARKFAETYIHLQDTVWRGFESMSRYQIFVRVLQRAVELKRITMRDFDTDDQAVMKKITVAPDGIINTLLDVLRLPSIDHLPKEDAPSFAKPRFVDPLIVEGDITYHLSERSAAFAQRLIAAKERNAQGVLLASPERILAATGMASSQTSHP